MIKLGSNQNGGGVQDKQCRYCERKFSKTEHLQRHQRSHTGERPYTCPECNKSFSRSDVLNRHLRNHPTNRRGINQYTKDRQNLPYPQAADTTPQKQFSPRSGVQTNQMRQNGNIVYDNGPAAAGGGGGGGRVGGFGGREGEMERVERGYAGSGFGGMGGFQDGGGGGEVQRQTWEGNAISGGSRHGSGNGGVDPNIDPNLDPNLAAAVGNVNAAGPPPLFQDPERWREYWSEGPNQNQSLVGMRGGQGSSISGGSFGGGEGPVPGEIIQDMKIIKRRKDDLDIPARRGVGNERVLIGQGGYLDKTGDGEDWNENKREEVKKDKGKEVVRDNTRVLDVGTGTSNSEPKGW